MNTEQCETYYGSEIKLLDVDASYTQVSGSAAVSVALGKAKNLDSLEKIFAMTIHFQFRDECEGMNRFEREVHFQNFTKLQNFAIAEINSGTVKSLHLQKMYYDMAVDPSRPIKAIYIKNGDKLIEVKENIDPILLTPEKAASFNEIIKKAWKLNDNSGTLPKMTHKKKCACVLI